MLNDFDRTYVINLPERKDRRIQMERHLGDLGATRVRFFPAVRADRARPFRSAEQAGCFLSHRRVLMEAYADGLESVLILEDDAEFVEPQTIQAAWAILRPQLDDTSWGVFQAGWLRLGGRAAPIDVTPTLMRMRERSGVVGAHCYAVHRRAMAALIAHLDRQLTGSPDDEVFGPMPLDGSLNTFAYAHEEVERFIALPSLCLQRSSRSDISPRILDRTAGVRLVMPQVRRVRSFVGRVRRSVTSNERFGSVHKR